LICLDDRRERSALVNPALTIPRIDTRRDDVQAALDALRQKLSPAGNVVSEAGRKKTIEVFGGPCAGVFEEA
jgi:histidinol dehydrogenase